MTQKKIYKYAALCHDEEGDYMNMNIYNSPEEAEKDNIGTFVKAIKFEI